MFYLHMIALDMVIHCVEFSRNSPYNFNEKTHTTNKQTQNITFM